MPSDRLVLRLTACLLETSADARSATRFPRHCWRFYEEAHLRDTPLGHGREVLPAPGTVTATCRPPTVRVWRATGWPMDLEIEAVPTLS